MGLGQLGFRICWAELGQMWAIIEVYERDGSRFMAKTHLDPTLNHSSKYW